jgi:hypothetical protein
MIHPSPPSEYRIVNLSASLILDRLWTTKRVEYPRRSAPTLSPPAWRPLRPCGRAERATRGVGDPWDAGRAQVRVPALRAALSQTKSTSGTADDADAALCSGRRGTVAGSTLATSECRSPLAVPGRFPNWGFAEGGHRLPWLSLSCQHAHLAAPVAGPAQRGKRVSRHQAAIAARCEYLGWRVSYRRNRASAGERNAAAN